MGNDPPIDEAPIGITIADARQPDEPLIYLNDAFERLTGYPKDETIGVNCRFLQGDDDAYDAAWIGERVPTTDEIDPEAWAGTRDFSDVTLPVDVDAAIADPGDSGRSERQGVTVFSAFRGKGGEKPIESAA